MRIIAVCAATILLAISARAQTDSMRLTNGETLEGSVEGVFSSGVRFTPTDGATADHSWALVSHLRTGRVISIEFGTGNRLNATIASLESQTSLQLDAEILGPVSLLVSTLPGAPPLPSAGSGGPEEDKGAFTPNEWNGHVALGGSLSAGNTQNIVGTLDLLVRRDWAWDQAELRAHAIYGTLEGTTTANAQRLSGVWRHFYTEEFYSYGSLEFGRDELADLNLRILANVGAGYRIWNDSAKEFFSLEGGIGYRHESFESAEPVRNDPTVRLAVDYNDLWGDAEFHQGFELIFPATDSGAFLARSRTSLSIPFSESWAVNTALSLSWLNDPAQGREELDILWTVGVRYIF